MFQLAVGLNLVLSAYAELRQAVEDKIEQKIDDTRRRISEVLQKQRAHTLGGEEGNGRIHLDHKWLKQVTDFVDRYYRRKHIFAKIDHRLRVLLFGAAALAFASLLIASAFAKSKVPNIFLTL